MHPNKRRGLQEQLTWVHATKVTDNRSPHSIGYHLIIHHKLFNKSQEALGILQYKECRITCFLTELYTWLKQDEASKHARARGKITRRSSLWSLPVSKNGSRHKCMHLGKFFLFFRRFPLPYSESMSCRTRHSVFLRR